MKVKELLGVLGYFLIIGAVFFVFCVITAIIIFGAAWASTKLLPWLSVLSRIAFGCIVFIIFPLAIPKATRGFSSAALFIASFVFGVTLWMEGLLLTLSIWGLVAVFIGIFLGGIGVVPIAMLATLINSMWGPLIELALLTIATFGSRFGARSLAASLEG